jgi:hypothetical protein
MNSIESNFEMGVGGWLGIIVGVCAMSKDYGRHKYTFAAISPFVGSFLYWGATALVRQSIYLCLSTIRSLYRFDAIACFLMVLFLSGAVFPTIHTLRMWTAPPAPPTPPPSEPSSEASSEPSSTDTSTHEETDESKEPESDESPIPSRRQSNVSDRVRVINEDGSDSPLSFEKVGSDDDADKKKN